ncbi:TRAP transporter small permease [Thermodesulfobacteriota bacterium]
MMNNLIDVVRRVIIIGMVGGAFLMVALMALTVANVTYRLFGGVIQGTYELTEVMIAISAGFALSYTALNDRNVVVQLVVSRFSKRIQEILKAFNFVLGMGIWGLMAWMTIQYLLKRGVSGEGYTETLEIPYFPIKCVWAIALILCSVVFVVKLIRSLQQVVDK